jgi:hypothetical protein
MKHFRDDNTEGYSAEELETLNAAFDIAFEAEIIPLDADPDFISDTRQHVGERIEAAYQPGMSCEAVLDAYVEARTRYRAWLATQPER